MPTPEELLAQAAGRMAGADGARLPDPAVPPWEHDPEAEEEPE